MMGTKEVEEVEKEEEEVRKELMAELMAEIMRVKQTKRRLVKALRVIRANIDVLEEEEMDFLLHVGDSIGLLPRKKRKGVK